MSVRWPNGIVRPAPTSTHFWHFSQFPATRFRFTALLAAVAAASVRAGKVRVPCARSVFAGCPAFTVAAATGGGGEPGLVRGGFWLGHAGHLLGDHGRVDHRLDLTRSGRRHRACPRRRCWQRFAILAVGDEGA